MVRFFLVSVAGLAVDIGIAFSIATLLGAPLWIAAATGFLVAACGNYILHKLWTFRREASRISRGRAVQYLIASAVTLMSRLAIVAWLNTWLSRDHALAILIGSAALSFFVSYAISSFLIFPRRTAKESRN